jgi:NAD(P)-dependent dehydrogenase (short-subunit alcohol dehydrogenase family)
LRLNGKVAVVTGSTRGLGRAIAEAYAREGAAVVVSSRTPDAVGATAATLREHGAVTLGVPCDVGELGQVRELASAAIERFGGIDIWVNNAALSASYGRTLDIPVVEYESVVRANILGMYYGSRVALDHMLARGQGKLINVTGRGAEEPVPFQNAYGPSKAWVVNFTLGLAKEYAGRGVDIIVFSPGMVLTDLMTDIDVVTPDPPRRLDYFPRILRMWAEPPEVPAQMAVDIAAEGKNGETYKYLTRWRLASGVLREIRRMVSRSDEPLPEVVFRHRAADETE